MADLTMEFREIRDENTHTRPVSFLGKIVIHIADTLDSTPADLEPSSISEYEYFTTSEDEDLQTRCFKYFAKVHEIINDGEANGFLPPQE